MEIIKVLLLTITILGLLGIIYVLIYNKLRLKETKIEHVEGIIDNDLRAKYDIIVRTNDILKKQKEKKEYLKEYISLKDEKIGNFELDRKLKEAENIILNLYHDNESLNENENMNEIINDFKTINEKITAGISYYNKQTSLLNNDIKKFPNNIIASIHKIKIKNFFDQRDRTDTDIEDFKL